MTILNRQVIASSDDCFRRLTPNYWSTTFTSVVAGADTPGDIQRGGGMRFTNLTIPKDATIDTAYLILRCSYANNGDDCNTRISADDVDNAVTFSTEGNFDTRWAARTAARVNWDNIPHWSVNVDYNSPEIKTVIQEIVNRAGWASGQDIVIFWEDFDDRSDHEADCLRHSYSYDSSTIYAPKLHIEYTPPVVAVGRSFGSIFG